MSYDVDIGDESLNYTSNGSCLFYDHIPAVEGVHQGGLWALNGLTGSKAASAIAEAFCRIECTRYDMWVLHDVGETNFRERYDTKNGWGSAIGGLLFLACIQAACLRNPRKKLRVSA